MTTRRASWVLAALLVAAPLTAQTADSSCVAAVMANADTLARLHLPGAELYPTQRRSRDRLNDVARARCTPVKPDTVRIPRVDTLYLPAPDSTQPVDTAGTPPVDSLPTDTATTPPDTTSPPPSGSGLAELPRTVPRFPAALATAPCTTTILAAALQAEVNRATAGAVLCLAPGAVARGTLTLPSRSDAGWVVIRTAPAPGQPVPGERVRPSQRASLATIEAPGTASAITTAPGAHGWAVVLLEVTTDSTLASWTNALIDLATPPSLAMMAEDIAFDRVWAHGWAHRPLRRCFALQSGATTIIDSWIDECHEKGSDSQAIISWSGTGPFRIEGNYIAGAGENIMFGGAQPAFHTVPCDITLRRNHIVTPPAWAVRDASGKTPWTKKNLVESKSSCRVLVEQNVIEGSWVDGQDGAAFVLKTSASSSSNVTAPYCRWCLTSDWTIRANLILRAVRPFAINGNSGSGQGNSDKADSLTRRIVIEDNFADSINVGPPYAASKAGFVQAFNNPVGVVFRRNTFLGSSLSHSWEMSTSKCPSVTDLTIEDNAWSASRYNIWGGTSTKPFVQCIAGVASLARNVLIGPPASVPSGFTFAPSIGTALTTGAGISRATIDAAVRGVVIQP